MSVSYIHHTFTKWPLVRAFIPKQLTGQQRVANVSQRVVLVSEFLLLWMLATLLLLLLYDSGVKLVAEQMNVYRYTYAGGFFPSHFSSLIPYNNNNCCGSD